MDFDKLKKAAKETFRIVSSKTDEKKESADETSAETGTHEETEDITAEYTQRIDLKNVFERFKKKKTASETENDCEPDEPEVVPETVKEAETSPAEDTDTKETAPATVTDDGAAKLKEKLDLIDMAIAAISGAEADNYTDIKNTISEVSESISQIRDTAASSLKQQSDLSDTVIARLNTTDKKLSHISNSLTGISKLSDSIFDLKNSQMNTRNSLGELEAAFYKLKKKMSASIMIISILSAVIAILEIINLLS